MMKKFIITSLLSATIVAPSWAEVCVKVGAGDNLSPAEQSATKSLLEGGFTKAGEKIAAEGCSQEYTLTNVRLGQAITTKVTGPKGTRQMQVDRIEELSSAYEQIAYSLVNGTKLGDNSSQGVSRHNVTAKQAAPMRVESDSLVQINFGSGLIFGASIGDVPINLGASYRYELDSFGIDIGGSFLIMPGDDDAAGSLQLTLSGLYFLDGEANHSLFVGGGLGLSSLGYTEDEKGFSGGGMHAKLAVGYSFFRASRIRMLVQADLTLPFYSVEYDPNSILGIEIEGAMGKVETAYAPILGITIGAAYTRANSTNSSIVRVF